MCSSGSLIAPRPLRTHVARTSPTFNHAMIYVKDLARSLGFYRDALGFRTIEETEGYARLRGPKGSGTIALHAREVPSRGDATAEAIRLYFEVDGLDAFCARLQRRGISFDRMPEDMPWGWRHAYLRDPDGHEISLYRAGAKRFRKSARKGP